MVKKVRMTQYWRPCTPLTRSVYLEIAYGKARTYLEHDCVFSEFGTRRRRSYRIQDLVVRTLIRANNDYQNDEAAQKAGGDKGKLMGTSNVSG